MMISKAAYHVRMRAAGLVALIASLILLSACDVFSTRTPAPPVEEGGTYVQPDTPDQVVDNIQNAIAELNAQNYRRSFGETLRFEPTADASARDPSIWTGWSAQEEESYFRSLAEAARLTTGNVLRLTDVEQEAGPTEYRITATYLLTVNHRRPDLSPTVQGRLEWTITQGEDGLWRLTGWTDRMLGDASSWSDLKAAFIK